VVGSMESHINIDSNGEFVISNPVNPEENFADKWPTLPKRKENFFKWMRKVKSDLDNIINARGLQLRENIGSMFGDDFSRRLFNRITEQHKAEVAKSAIKVGATGLLGGVGKTVNATNTFYGEE
jgi:hypothetical protein